MKMVGVIDLHQHSGDRMLSDWQRSGLLVT